MLRPPLSQFESLMKWAESRSVIVPPYLCSDFIAASVAPTKVMSQAKPSPDAYQCHADDSECSGDEQLDLSPLRPQDDDDFEHAFEHAHDSDCPYDNDCDFFDCD